jgi:chitinase
VVPDSQKKGGSQQQSAHNIAQNLTSNTHAGQLIDYWHVWISSEDDADMLLR